MGDTALGAEGVHVLSVAPTEGLLVVRMVMRSMREGRMREGRMREGRMREGRMRTGPARLLRKPVPLLDDDVCDSTKLHILNL